MDPKDLNGLAGGVREGQNMAPKRPIFGFRALLRPLNESRAREMDLLSIRGTWVGDHFRGHWPIYEPLEGSKARY